MSSMVRISVNLTKKQADAIQKEADRLQINFSEMLRRILDEWRISIGRGS